MLQPEGLDTLRARSSEHHPRGRNCCGEFCILGEEAIARDDSLGTTLFCDFDDAISTIPDTLSVVAMTGLHSGGRDATNDTIRS